MKSRAKATGLFGRLVRRTARLIERGLAVVGLATIVYIGCFEFSRITSESMEPTLIGSNWEKGDRVISEKVSYRFRQPRRWELVTFRHEDGSIIVKRVVGLPGERIQMLRKGRIIINGSEVPRPDRLNHLVYFPFGNLVAGLTAECGEGYYVLGDYSKDSDDSRFNGPVPAKKIIGRPWYIYYPAERRGFLQH